MEDKKVLNEEDQDKVGGGIGLRENIPLDRPKIPLADKIGLRDKLADDLALAEDKLGGVSGGIHIRENIPLDRPEIPLADKLADKLAEDKLGKVSGGSPDARVQDSRVDLADKVASTFLLTTNSAASAAV